MVAQEVAWRRTRSGRCVADQDKRMFLCFCSRQMIGTPYYMSPELFSNVVSGALATRLQCNQPC